MEPSEPHIVGSQQGERSLAGRSLEEERESPGQKKRQLVASNDDFNKTTAEPACTDDHFRHRMNEACLPLRTNGRLFARGLRRKHKFLHQLNPTTPITQDWGDF
ncbi:expressed unknown protein [Seminavis robusta]|uniref:Uncharacterized protein n=1 Tax=Seminavis robusta TaxID=568900 RepID=A0A9N8EHQ4_9STRA|nr:expressed unknown protein [Seminavis robusta]|eukprot:Sro1011_g231110.1 n/a (104) ;mRNA; r:36289-36600